MIAAAVIPYAPVSVGRIATVLVVVTVFVNDKLSVSVVVIVVLLVTLDITVILLVKLLVTVVVKLTFGNKSRAAKPSGCGIALTRLEGGARTERIATIISIGKPILNTVAILN